MFSFLRRFFESSYYDRMTPNDISNCEEKIYSQNGEDGIIRAILQKIGTTNRFCVEFGVGDGSECNTRYLIEKEGWSYLLMDAIQQSPAGIHIQAEFITPENINDLFRKYAVPRQFDLLSVDIDYNTYWVWKALEGYQPRVVVIEYNASFGPTESFAVENDPNGKWDGTHYFGASLLAFVKLGKAKGYTLVGCESLGVNAFFVRDDLVSSGGFKSESVEDLYKPPGYGEIAVGAHFGHPRSKRHFVPV